jgi:hypothetical protein
MAEFLIKVQSYVHADAEKDKRGVYKLGDIVDVRPDAHPWGNEERLPKFVVVKVPGLDPTTVMDKMKSWHFQIQYDILSSDLPTDTHTIKISGTDFHAGTGEGKVVASKVQTFLEAWNAVNIVETDNAVTFDINILEAIKSRHFWDLDVSELVFTETNYTQVGGTHRVRINYDAVTWDQKQKDQALSQIQRMGAFVSQNPSLKTIVVDIDRQNVREKFQADVQRKAEHVLRRRKHHFLDTVVQQAIDAGGTLTLTVGELAAASVRVTQFAMELIQQAVAQNVSVTQLTIEIIVSTEEASNVGNQYPMPAFFRRVA